VTRAGSLNVAGEYDESIRVGREAISLVDRLASPTLRSRVRNSVGTSRAFLGDAEGLSDIRQAVEIARESNAFMQVHAALNNMSEAQAFLGDLGDAAKTYEELVEMVEHSGRDTDRRWARATFAIIRAQEGRWDDALILLDPFIAETEAGSPHYLEPTSRVARARIRLARGDVSGASTDATRALEVARPAMDPQVVVPALQARASMLVLEGRLAESGRLVDEMLDVGPKLVGGSYFELPDLAWISRILERGARLIELLAEAPEVPWTRAAAAIASGDSLTAASILADIGSRPDEAYARLRAAQELAADGRRAEADEQLGKALAFYRSVAAARYVREGEALLGGRKPRPYSETAGL
jgi:tetratricopeptide (TPR) repeat protein